MRSFIILSLFVCLGIVAFGQTKVEADSLTKLLEAVYQKDQMPRNQLDSIEYQYGYTSVQVSEQWKLIKRNDSVNINVVTSILDNYGWLSKNQTSETANSALFLVIQHADIKVQLKYIELLKKAVEKSIAEPWEYAYLLDRVYMKQGKLQIYGSQRSVSTNGKSYFYPIKDCSNVNKRRKNIGLPALSEVSPQPGSVYNLPAKNILKNNVVVTGFVIERDNTPIGDANIRFGSKIVGKSNADGFYVVIIEKKLLKEQLTYSKKGYAISDPPLNDEGKEVYELNIMLTKD